MKKIITLVVAGAVLFSCGETKEAVEEVAQEMEEETTESTPIQVVEGFTHYGVEKVNMDHPMDVHTFATALAEGNTENCTVKAELASICAKAGCFVIVNLPDSSEMRVMFKDHFTIPTDTEIGTEAIFVGEAKMDTTSIADLQHYIMDEMEGENVSEEKKAELQKEYDAVTEPEIEPIFIASGILVKG